MLELITRILFYLFCIGALLTIGLPFILIAIFYILGLVLLAIELITAFIGALVRPIINIFRR